MAHGESLIDSQRERDTLPVLTLLAPSADGTPIHQIKKEKFGVAFKKWLIDHGLIMDPEAAKARTHNSQDYGSGWGQVGSGYKGRL